MWAHQRWARMWHSVLDKALAWQVQLVYRRVKRDIEPIEEVSCKTSMQHMHMQWAVALLLYLLDMLTRFVCRWPLLSSLWKAELTFGVNTTFSWHVKPAEICPGGLYWTSMMLQISAGSSRTCTTSADTWHVGQQGLGALEDDAVVDASGWQHSHVVLGSRHY